MTTLVLEVRRVIAATPERLFAAWTTPAELVAWWGPRGVRCTGAEVDARPGGRYRLDHALPDGRRVTIAGEFLTVDPPRALVFTWQIDPGPREQVTVRFEPHPDGTEVIIVHERIADARARDEHAAGWDGCLAGLATHAAGS